MTTLTIEKPDTWSTSFQWLDSTDNPVDMTGFGVTITVTIGPDEFIYTEESPEVSVDLITGTVRLTVASSVVRNLKGHFGEYEVIVSRDDFVMTLAEGAVYVSD